MGQNMILTIVALILLGNFLVASNGLVTDNMQTASENEYVITALSLAQSVLEEAKTKAFDQKAIGVTITSTSQLTDPLSLGPDAGETFTTPDVSTGSAYRSSTAYNDIDDYNGYARLVNTPRASGYRISVSVCYASETNPDSTASGKTFCKRMTISVTSPNFSMPVSLQYAFTY